MLFPERHPLIYRRIQVKFAVAMAGRGLMSIIIRSIKIGKLIKYKVIIAFLQTTKMQIKCYFPNVTH